MQFIRNSAKYKKDNLQLKTIKSIHRNYSQETLNKCSLQEMSKILNGNDILDEKSIDKTQAHKKKDKYVIAMLSQILFNNFTSNSLYFRLYLIFC